jgi:hypothetical protein
MHNIIKTVMTPCARIIDAFRHPERPPILGIRYRSTVLGGRQYVCTDLAYAAMITLVNCNPLTEFVTVPHRFRHLDVKAIPESAWVHWRTIPTGEFLERIRHAGGRIGRYHASGEAALVGQGYDRDDAAKIVATFETAARSRAAAASLAATATLAA